MDNARASLGRDSTSVKRSAKRVFMVVAEEVVQIVGSFTSNLCSFIIESSGYSVAAAWSTLCHPDTGAHHTILRHPCARI